MSRSPAGKPERAIGPTIFSLRFLVTGVTADAAGLTLLTGGGLLTQGAGYSNGNPTLGDSKWIQSKTTEAMPTGAPTETPTEAPSATPTETPTEVPTGPKTNLYNIRTI